VYDGKMRRRIRQECTWQGGIWVQTNEVYYVYDGNLVIQERDVNNLPTTTYTRGLDLSGSLQGAGGIGGLLARTSQAYADGPLAGQSYYHCDGNANVTMLINNSQAIVAKYLYDAFGNIISKSGLLADANIYRFSSKEAHPNSGLVYYLYRYYDPNLQRWPNRDPLSDYGSLVYSEPNDESLWDFIEINLYRPVGNSPVNSTDPYGQNPIVVGVILGTIGVGILIYETYHGMKAACHAQKVADDAYLAQNTEAGECPPPLPPSKTRDFCKKHGWYK
jgi:RHS repeat-associated protein